MHAARLHRYFANVACDKPIQRGSWGLEVGQPLYLQPGDAGWVARVAQDPALRLADVHLRVDWQTLRRLPRSRAVVFNYKALFTPLTQLRREPCIPRLLATVLREGPPAILDYKGTHHTLHVALPALDAWAEEQEEKGRVPRGWKARTLDENPFFPGWERGFESRCYS